MKSPQVWNRFSIACACALGVVGFFVGRISVATSADSGHQSGLAESKLSSPTSAHGHPPPASSETALQPFEDARAPRGALPSSSAERFRTLAALALTPARADSMCALLEEIAARNPAEAMNFVQAQTNLLLKGKFLQASLRGWAGTFPREAAKWALSVPPPEAREAALASVFVGAAASNPTAAVALGNQLIHETPGEAVSLGGHLIDALCERGNFAEAARLAASGDQGQTSFWVGEAFSKWASFQPQQAMQAAGGLSDPELRKLAMSGLVSGLSEVDPSAAVQLAAEWPPESGKNDLLGPALRRWTKLDPKVASEWINNHDGGGAMDAGVTSLATMEALEPAVAFGWAESVVDPKIRSETLVTVLRNLATTDLAAAKQYFVTHKNLLPEDRMEVAGVIATLSGESPHE